MTILSRFRSLRFLPAALVALMVPASAFAGGPAPVLNGLSNDYPTLQVATPGGTYQTSINAQSGDTLNLLVWDHNSVPDSTAKNVKVQVNLPTAEALAHNVTATVGADNAETVKGSISITTPGATKLSYVAGSARLLKNVLNGDKNELVPTSWPTGVNGDNVITTGVNLGDQDGCWQYARAILLQVKLEGPIVVPHAVLSIKKEVRRTSDDAFTTRTTVNPGARVEYKLTAKNIDNQGLATQIKLQDYLPAGVTYVAGSAKLTKPNGEVSSLSDGMASANGMIVLPELKAGETVIVTFLADTVTTFKNGECAVNRVKVSAENASNSPEATADTCFVTVTPPATPTPTPPTPKPPVKPTPQPTLPHTGGNGLELVAGTLFSGFGLSTGRYALLKRKLKKQAKNIDIV